MGRLYSSICGSETITRQQKNTSFGANTFRDGVSYNEHQQERPLVKLDDFAKLRTGECYVLLPNPDVRLSKIDTPEVNIPTIHASFIVNEQLKMMYDTEERSGADDSNGDNNADMDEGTTRTKSDAWQANCCACCINPNHGERGCISQIRFMQQSQEESLEPKVTETSLTQEGLENHIDAKNKELTSRDKDNKPELDMA